MLWFYNVGFSKFYYDLFFKTVGKVLSTLNETIAALENLETDVTTTVDNLGTYPKNAQGVIGTELCSFLRCIPIKMSFNISYSCTGINCI